MPLTIGRRLHGNCHNYPARRTLRLPMRPTSPADGGSRRHPHRLARFVNRGGPLETVIGRRHDRANTAAVECAMLPARREQMGAQPRRTSPDSKVR